MGVLRQPRPTLVRERAAWAAEHLLIGVDEAGRGPLAGPVVAAAVVFPPGTVFLRGLRDSKTISAATREELAGRIRGRALAIGVGAASSREIDRLNIRVATALAMRRAIGRVRVTLAGDAAARARVLIDGLPMREIGYTHDALVDGDALCHSIAAAGIVAKTVRDLLMQKLARRYPNYGWETNVGYGTARHQAGLLEHGPSRHHRRTFAPVMQLGLPL